MMKNKIWSMILIFLFTGILVLGIFQVYRQLKEYEEGDSAYTDMEKYILIKEPEDNNDKQEKKSQSGERKPDINWPVIDFAALEKINPSIVAWIYIEGTEINYPVVQGKDNQYYLKHLFNGEWNSSGCIFLDSRNTPDFSDRHSIIYGHHMKDGSMFSRLTEYKKPEFYHEHPVILLVTPDRNLKIEIFAGYVANVKENAWEIAFGSDADFEEWLEEAKERSYFESEVTPAVTDRIVTLSTCSYEFNNARFVVAGVISE